MKVVTKKEAKRILGYHINGKVIFKVAINPKADDNGANNSISQWKTFDNFNAAQEYFRTLLNQLHLGDKIIMNWYVVDNADSNIIITNGMWAWSDWNEYKNKKKEPKNLFLTIIFSVLGIILGLILIFGWLHLH
jgi:hypothetical protein